ncbi:hypothetical protein FA95DRAFT_1504685 [Auriscalpium vulgare]|uniref:Uncharacterized protein n=1 Tax=Auriscalpium vulgare TaxID=40419 RepID=A0ACB8R4S8_9AGAM|nr:hypothetical protein FA95DRAFT_1504685 [Auriscalpium vulgare]
MPKQRRKRAKQVCSCTFLSQNLLHVTQASGNPVKDWLPLRDTYLDEMMRLDGLGDHTDLPMCLGCSGKEGGASSVGEFRCESCTGGVLMCADCTVSAHATHPFHRIQKWNGHFFERVALQQLGLRVQLGHDGLPCPSPHERRAPLVVIDVSGIHEVNVNYCECGHVTAQRLTQLLRASWWPATVTRPSTVTTFATLKLFHALSLQGKMNAYDFYSGLVRITDGIGVRKSKYRYKEFIRSMRCFRNARAAKRAGRAHDPAGIQGTDQGGFVVECPLCPRPGRNMPEGWEDAPADEAWKHALFLAMDANFKLKLKNRGLADVELAPGMGYFVNSNLYNEFMKDYIDEPEPKHCESNHSAVSDANKPTAKRFAINGVGAVICSRHCFYRKHSVCDLQKGEKYSSMDYILLSTIAMTAKGIKKCYISYDIACSFHKNFTRRMAKHPLSRQIDISEMLLRWLIPKFHLLAHGAACQGPFSHNNTKGVGRAHGEGIEGGWAELNGAALSTREMAKGARQENLDDVLGAINWRKLINIGPAHKKSIKAAVYWRAKQKASFEEADEKISAELRQEWEDMVNAYEEDRTRPNPYEEPETSKLCPTSMADVRIELAGEEAEQAALGHISPHETTASVFLSTGMDLQDQQRLLVMRAAGLDGTPASKATLKERQNVLRHRITAWRAIQQIYMPGTANLLTSATDSPGDAAPDPSKITLLLPSELSHPLRASVCVPGLAEKETRLRRAQAEDSLHQVRRFLRVSLGLRHYKRVHVDGPGQKANTRARGMIDRLEDKKKRYIARYRASHSALCALEPDGDWTSTLHQLKDDDIRAPRLVGELGQGTHTVSWIWKSLKQDARDFPREDQPTDQDVLESVRVDWATSRARYLRWDEEVQHLLMEMQRCILDFEYSARTWDSQMENRSDAPDSIKSGLRAYAARQAAQYRALSGSFVNMWRPVLRALNLPELWPSTAYPPTAVTAEDRRATAPTHLTSPTSDSDESLSADDRSSLGGDESGVESVAGW